MILKNGDYAGDRRLGCIIEKKELVTSSKHPLLFFNKKLKPVSREWRASRALDQGSEGCCVSMGIAHELLTPDTVLPPALTDVPWCKEHIYWPAQDIDPWPGSARDGAEPFYEGTTLEAGLIVAKRMGLITSWQWATSIEDVLIGWSHYRPPVFALHWKSGMMNPDAMGTIRYTGRSQGGHCICGSSLEIPRWPFSKKWCWLQQSWGIFHGYGGRVRISADDLEAAMNDYGQAAFLNGRRKSFTM